MPDKSDIPDLYHSHKSTCSQKVRLCLAELGLEYTSHPVNLETGEQISPQFLAINPNGVVPALVHRGISLVESTVICEYLCEVYPDPNGLLPKHALERAQMRAWLRYIDEMPSMAVRVVTFQRELIPFYQQMSEAEFDEFSEAMPVRKYFFKKMGRDGFSEQDYEDAIEQLCRTFTRMESTLKATGWLVGEQCTIADLCMLPVIERLEDLGMSELWSDYPRVIHWINSMRNRPSFNIAFYAGTRFP